MRRRAVLAVLIALLVILFVAAPPPVIANTAKSGEPTPVLTVAITGDMEGTLFAIVFGTAVFRDDTESAMATWTSFQRGDGLTIAAIPALTSAPTATVREATHGAITGSPWRLSDCTGTSTAHDGTDIRKPTALVASTGGRIDQPLRR